MSEMALGVRIEQMLIDELGDIGPFILKKQCSKLGLDRNNIRADDLPSLSAAISEAMTLFGTAKAKSIHERIKKLSKMDNVVRTQANPHKRLEMVLDLGRASQLAGDWEDALARYDEAETIAKGLQFWVIVAKLQRDRSAVYLRLGMHDDAEKSAMAALEISKRTSNKEGVARAHRSLGNVYWRKGLYARAVGHLEETLHLAQALANSELEAGALMGLANVYDEQGRYNCGIDCSKRALEILTREKDLRAMATLNNNLGVAYARKGDYKTAASHYEQCIELSRKAEYVVMEGWALFNLAECFAEMMRIDEAIQRTRESEEIFTRLKDDLGMSGVHMAYAIAYRNAGRWDECRRHFRETIAIRVKMNMPYRLADARLEYARALITMGDGEKAVTEALSAKEIFEELGNKLKAKEARSIIDSAGTHS